MKNLYEILEVKTNATQEEIKLAYKKLVRIYHPDINKSTDSELNFKLLNNAYDILSDKIKKENYDKLLEFEKPTIQNLTPNKDSIIKEVKITEEEAQKGTKRTVNILNTQKCPRCMGKRFLNGIKCPYCLGEGEKREHKKIEVEIKEGIKNGEFIYVGKINSSAVLDKNLFLKITVEPALKLFFEGDSIFVKVEIPIYDAVLGVQKEINIESLGLFGLYIPPLTKNGTKIPIETEDKNLNCYATIEVIFPESVSKEEKNLYDRIRKINSGKNNASKY